MVSAFLLIRRTRRFFNGSQQPRVQSKSLTECNNSAGTSASSALAVQVCFSPINLQRKISKCPTIAEIAGSNSGVQAELIDAAEENTKLTDCYYEKKDWRLCKDEVSDDC